MSEWRIEYENDTGPNDEGLNEWWVVTDGGRRFQCDAEADAKFLLSRLSEWQSIETAPKDETVIMVWDGRRHFLIRSDDFKFLPPQTYWLDAVTHWMPLPPPPKDRT